jgi:hypothetical protein
MVGGMATKKYTVTLPEEPGVHQAARQAWPRWVADWPPL